MAIAEETAPCLVPLDGPLAWSAKDLAEDQTWMHTLTPVEIDQLATALDAYKSKGIDPLDATAEDFPVSELDSCLSALRHEVLHGRGLFVLRGLPIGHRFSEEDASLIYWGLGLNIGTPVPQNAKGELLGHLVAHRRQDDPNKRPYDTNTSQPYHADRCDVVALMCVRQARRGGQSGVASAINIHNIMLSERPDLIPYLYRTQYHDRLGEESGDQLPYYAAPIYTYIRGELTCSPGIGRILNAQRFDDVPRLESAEIEAMEYLLEITKRDDVGYTYTAKPGDIQYLNNYRVLHNRAEWEDYDDFSRWRYMVRLWLKLNHAFALTREYEARRDALILRDGVSPNVAFVASRD